MVQKSLANQNDKRRQAFNQNRTKEETVRCRANAVRRRLRRRAHHSVPASQSRPAPNHCRKHNEERGVPPLDPRQPLAQHMIQHPESAHHRDTIRFVWHDISSYGQGGSGRAEEGGLPLNFIGWLSGLGSGGRTTTTRRRDRRRHRDGNGSPYSSLVCNSAAGSNLNETPTQLTFQFLLSNNVR